MQGTILPGVTRKSIIDIARTYGYQQLHQDVGFRLSTPLGDDDKCGAKDVALIEYARLTGRPFRVFSLDTGRLNPKTYRFFDAVEKHYDIRIEYMFPDSVEVQALIRSKGLFSFYEDGHQECC
ncbi:hypothetical protein QJS10_CPA05g01685 [Acorus calamus]|uniref:Phosphoadenosine phosphosulphate reductase domain-containing protein n=1 Tax=Acorus calamus TaxID=4465 RepID=A0AAV9EWH1_ACOCL|nr:hypothetical protein QJS10_CPA05g01685 [Acorus calamus]